MDDEDPGDAVAEAIAWIGEVLAQHGVDERDASAFVDAVLLRLLEQPSLVPVVASLGLDEFIAIPEFRVAVADAVDRLDGVHAEIGLTFFGDQTMQIEMLEAIAAAFAAMVLPTDD